MLARGLRWAAMVKRAGDMILYADRFSLFNRNNATAVPVMVAEGNELYIDTARIKNSS